MWEYMAVLLVAYLVVGIFVMVSTRMPCFGSEINVRWWEILVWPVQMWR